MTLLNAKKNFKFFISAAVLWPVVCVSDISWQMTITTWKKQLHQLGAETVGAKMAATKCHMPPYSHYTTQYNNNNQQKSSDAAQKPRLKLSSNVSSI